MHLLHRRNNTKPFHGLIHFCTLAKICSELWTGDSTSSFFLPFHILLLKLLCASQVNGHQLIFPHIFIAGVCLLWPSSSLIRWVIFRNQFFPLTGFVHTLFLHFRLGSLFFYFFLFLHFSLVYCVLCLLHLLARVINLSMALFIC